jgi:hypothetical protein
VGCGRFLTADESSLTSRPIGLRLTGVPAEGMDSGPFAYIENHPREVSATHRELNLRWRSIVTILQEHPGNPAAGTNGVEAGGRTDPQWVTAPPPPTAGQNLPAGWYAAPPTPERVKGLKRPVTLGGLLIAVFVTAVLFASVGAAMVLTDTGPRGPQGQQGQQGQVGSKGIQGIRGRTGKNGATGLAGAPGAQGAQGAEGTPGATRACSNDPAVPLPYC